MFDQIIRIKLLIPIYQILEDKKKPSNRVAKVHQASIIKNNPQKTASLPLTYVMPQLPNIKPDLLTYNNKPRTNQRGKLNKKYNINKNRRPTKDLFKFKNIKEADSHTNVIKA